MSIDPKSFRLLMGRFATGVTIVSMNEDGTRRGLTVSDFASVSLDPPLVSINIEREARSHRTLMNGAGFTVNILNSTQKELALTFAEPGLSMDRRFSEAEFSPGKEGGPRLTESLAWLECRQEQSHQAGDHTIFVGRVVRGNVSDDGKPLLYYEGNFGHFTSP